MYSNQSWGFPLTSLWQKEFEIEGQVTKKSKKNTNFEGWEIFRWSNNLFPSGKIKFMDFPNFLITGMCVNF